MPKNLAFATENNNYKKILIHSIDAKNKTIEQIEKDNKKFYDNLGISKAIKLAHDENSKKGLKLVKEEIFVEKKDYDGNKNYMNIPVEVGNDTDYTNLSKYKGKYPMRYVTVTDHYIHNTETIAKGTKVKDALNTAISVIVGTTPPWIWIPATILDLDVMNIFIDTSRPATLTARLSEKFTYHYYQIKDIDNKYNYQSDDWYCYGYTMKSDVTTQVMLTAYDQNNNLIKPNYNEATKTLYSKYYNNDSYLCEKIYNAYIGNGYEFYDTTPFPHFEK